MLQNKRNPALDSVSSCPGSQYSVCQILGPGVQTLCQALYIKLVIIYINKICFPISHCHLMEENISRNKITEKKSKTGRIKKRFI